MKHYKEKNKKILIFGVVLLVMIGLVFFVYFPMINKSNQWIYATQKMEKDIQIAKNIIESKRLSEKKVRLISKKEIVLAIDEIMKAGKDKNIRFLSISPKEIESMDNFRYAHLPIEISLVSQYKDIGLYLKALGDLKVSMVDVENFEIKRDEALLPLVKTQMVLEVYLENE